jgi:hypothetical protein
MFEIKYDREGNPIREQNRMEEYAKQAEAVAPAPQIQHFPDEPQEAIQETQEDTSPAYAAPQEEVESEDVDTSPAPVEPEPEPESAAKKSFRELSAAKKKAERERDEYRQLLAEMQAAKNPAPAAPVEEDDDFRLGDDDIAEGKHISKVDKRAQSKIKALEQRLQQYERETAESRAETKLRTQYPDFDKVVTRENIELFAEAYPDVAQSLNSNNDLYSKASSAYKMIKKFGIYQESPFASEKAVAIKNVAKPRPLASVSPQQGDTPMSRANAFANGLTDDLRAQLRKEMEQSRMR